MKSDIEIAQECIMEKIEVIAGKVGLSEDNYSAYGKYKAKVDHRLLKEWENREDAKVILVTAISPTPAGEGKPTTTLGLGDALTKFGYKW